LAPGVESVIDRAVTAPVESACPTAVAHLPTARSPAEPVVRWVYVVAAVNVTATLDVFCVWGLVSLTVTVDPFTPDTEPEAAPKPPAANRPPPLGRSPEPPPGNPPPLLPPLPPRAKAPPPAPPAPPKPREQVPDVGWVMVTVVAVTGSPNADLVDDEVEVGFPNAEMQDPTVTSVAAAATVCSKVVAVV
jgi:hypothetical protein